MPSCWVQDYSGIYHPTPILLPATLVPRRPTFLKSSKMTFFREIFSLGSRGRHWDQMRAPPAHSPTEAVPWGHKAWSGPATSGLSLFPVTGALAGTRPTQCPSSSQRVYWGCFWVLRGVQASSTYSHQLKSVPSRHQRLCHCVSSPVLGAAGPASDSSAR